MPHLQSSILSLSLLAVAPACGEHHPFDEPLAISEPTATRSSVTWYDEARDELLVVRPGDDSLALHRVPIGDERTLVRWTRSTVEGDALLMMLVPATDKVEDVDDTLVIVPTDGDGEPQEIPVVAPFSSVELSPDGRLAVLYFGGNDGGNGLQNANQVAIVDLAAGTVRDLTLNGFGGQLQSVHFTNHDSAETPSTIRIGGADREVLAFLAESEVVLVDVADPTADQVSVNFRDAAFSPSETLLRVGNDLFDNPVLFLRGDGGSDVAMLTLVDQPDEATGTPGFTAQVSLLPVGGPATDFIAYDGATAPYLITVNPTTGSLVFTDIRTQQGFEVPLPGEASRIALRDLLTPQGPVKQAIAWAKGGGAVHTLRLDDIEGALGRSPERLDVQTGIEQLVVLDNDRALVGSGLDLYVLDFAQLQVTPLRSNVAYDPATSALENDRLLLGTPGQTWVSTVDLQTLDPESMVLDDKIGEFYYLPDPGKLVVVHPDLTGHVSVADALAPKRSTTYSVWGVFFENVLERPEEEEEHE